MVCVCDTEELVTEESGKGEMDYGIIYPNTKMIFEKKVSGIV